MTVRTGRDDDQAANVDLFLHDDRDLIIDLSGRGRYRLR
jgi:hypothetical protein